MINLLNFNVPEIGSAGTSFGLIAVTAVAVNKLGNLLDKYNPANKLYVLFENASANNIELAKENQEEIKALDKQINALKAMSNNAEQ